MINKLNLSHDFLRLLRYCAFIVRVGIGGSGREAARAAAAGDVVVHGEPSPFSLLREFDLTSATGRGVERPVEPSYPGAYGELLLPGVSCSAMVEEHGSDPRYASWEFVDSEEIRDVKDTRLLGGYANPQVARAAQEFFSDLIDNFLRSLAEDIERMTRLSHPGWKPSGAVQIHVYAGQNGAVGSTALHLVDRLYPALVSLNVPMRIVHHPLLMADHGRVVDREAARALTHAAMAEIHVRSRGAK